MYRFRKISAYSEEYISMREANEQFLTSFTLFSKGITASRKSAKQDQSGSAASYTGQLIRFGVIIGEYINSEVFFNSTTFYKELENIRKHENYHSYNVKLEGRFPNAAIERYYEYQAYLALKEDVLFDVLEESTDEVSILEGHADEKENIQRIIKRKKSNEYFLRTQKEREKALKLAINMCENDEEHLTFISKRTGKQYVEAHHLIPLAYQGLFQKSLDVAENIIILCPNCHREFHHGTSSSQKELISSSYYKRKVDLISKIEDISLEKLFNFYGI